MQNIHFFGVCICNNNLCMKTHICLAILKIVFSQIHKCSQKKKAGVLIHAEREREREREREKRLGKRVPRRRKRRVRCLFLPRNADAAAELDRRKKL